MKLSIVAVLAVMAVGAGAAAIMEGRGGAEEISVRYDHDSWPSYKIAKRDLRFADARCPEGFRVCAVQSPWAREAWECIDTTRDLESCGGCMAALADNYATGQDCTAIEGVEDVACQASACRVFSCRMGYVVAADARSCVPGDHKDHHKAAGIHFRPQE